MSGAVLSLQVVILERRNAAGKAFFKPVTAWNGSEEDKQRVVEELERLHKDPSLLRQDAMLPELNNEFASVGPSLACSLTTSPVAKGHFLSPDVLGPMGVGVLRLPL